MHDDLPMDRSPFAVLDDAFHQLARPPSSLSIDGRTIGHGLPARPIRLDALRALLLKPSTSYAARDAAVAVLLRQAQTGTQAEVIGLAGILLPGLVSAAAPLLRARPDLRDDLELEILARLFTLIRAVPPDQDRLAARLIARATRAGYRLLRQDRKHRGHLLLPEALVEPPIPQPHPDFLLARAVEEGVVHRDEAELIAQTRISGVSIRTLAAGSQQTYKGLQKRRIRAERRLVAWLLTRSLSTNQP